MNNTRGGDTLPVREDDGVGVSVQHRHHRLGLDEGLHLLEDHIPLDLVFWVVGAGVVGDLTVQLGDQLPHQLHLLQQQADDDETGVVPQLLHHQIGAILLRGPRIVSPAPDRRVERIRFVQVVRLASSQAATNANSYTFHRSVANSCVI